MNTASKYDLDEAIRELERSIRDTPITALHFIPDLVANGLAREVYEHTLAVRLLREQAMPPGTAYPLARSAFEAMCELVTLGLRPEYDHWGSRAYAAECFERVRSRELADKYFRTLGQPDGMPEPIPAAVAVEQTAVVWDQYAPGKGDVLRKAYENVRTDRETKGNKQFNWFGRSRSSMHRLAAQLLGGHGTHAMIVSWYQILSVQSHPYPRIDNHNLSVRVDGTFVFGVPDDQREQALGMGIGATVVAARTAAAVLAEIRKRRSRPFSQEEG